MAEDQVTERIRAGETRAVVFEMEMFAFSFELLLKASGIALIVLFAESFGKNIPDCRNRKNTAKRRGEKA